MAQHFIRFARLAAIVVASIGATVFAGWMFGIESLKSIYGPITMKTNAAMALVFAGAGLWCRVSGLPRTATVSASIAAAIGGLTLSEHLFGWDLGIDQLLFTEIPGAAATASPNRFGPHAATSFLLAGLTLILLGRDDEASTRRAQFLSFGGAAFALVATTGYVYGAEQLYGIARYTGIALHTSLALLILHGGILAASAERGFMRLFAGDGLAGTLLRRISGMVVLAPMVFGYLFARGRQEEIIDPGLGTSLFAVFTIVLLLVTLWRTATTIEATDTGRRHALETAERASQLKDQFIAVLSHELRTPLNVMLGRLHSLEGSVDDATRVRAAGIIARNGYLLARVVEDLLDHSRAASGQFEIARRHVELGTLVRGAVDAAAASAAAKGIALTCDLDPRLGAGDVDPLRLQQVLANLLSNSIKFTPAGGRIVVRAIADADRSRIVVEDNGIGFEASFAPFLFEPFRQADPSTRREYGGLGLGLSIARHLIEMHGGTIEASSPGPGQGATFVIRLPRLVSATVKPRQEATFDQIAAAL